MATKVKSDLTKKLEALEKRSKVARNRLKKLNTMIRGYFFPADDLVRLVNKSHYSNIHLDDITLSSTQITRIWDSVPCPCGHCEYYSVEVFKDGRYVVHHHSNGVVKSGRYK